MKKLHSIVSLLLALAMMLTMVGFAAAEDDTETRAYVVGDTMGDFTLTLSDGTTVTFSELLATHKAVLINIWATWCNPCCQEFPYMEEAYAQVKDDLAIVAVSCEPTDTDDVINAFKEENGLSILPMAADTIGLTDWFDYNGIPTSIMIDRNGVICWQESGSITSVDTFLRLFNAFIADDYSESLVGFEIPKVKPTVENPDVADAAAAMLAEGSNMTVSFSSDDEYAWPWVVDDDCVVASNTGIDDSYAMVCVTLNAEEGDVLSYDVKVSCEESYDYFYAVADGEIIKVIDGEKDWATYAAALTAGEHTVDFIYMKDSASSDGEDTAWLKNVKLVTGDEAAALIATLPVYPRALESGATMEIADENAKEIVIEYADPAYAETFDVAMGKCYIVDSDTVSVKAYIGKDVSTEMAAIYSNFDGVYTKLADAQIDGDAYIASSGVSAMDVDGYYNNSFYLYVNMFDDETDPLSITVFPDEQNVNTFMQTMNDAYGFTVVSSWHYADGTLPSTDEVAVAPESLQGNYGYVDYVLLFMDQDGNPVEGVMANVCDDISCTLMTADENGEIAFTNVPFIYHIQVIKVPDGYEFDTSAEYYTTEDGGEMVFTLTRTAE